MAAHDGSPILEAEFSDDLAVRLDAERMMEDAVDLLRQLPRKQQEVFALCVSELTYEEAALAAARSGSGREGARARLVRASLTLPIGVAASAKPG